MIYSTLGVILHDRCNAKCSICSLSCSPDAPNELDIDRLQEIISSCVGTTIKYVSFTGGEPFLRYKELKQLVTFTHTAGLKPSIVTNAFWATSLDESIKRLTELKDSGLERINFSCDNHHKEFIPISNINNAMLACETIELPYILAMSRLKDEKLGQIVDQFDHSISCLKLLVNACQPVGAAVENYSYSDFERPLTSFDSSCPYAGIVTIHSSGEIFPCCAHYVFQTNLNIANYSEVLMPEVLTRIKNNGLLYLLRNKGLAPFISEYPELALQNHSRFASPCEICANLFTSDFSFMDHFIKKSVTKEVETF